MAPAKKRITRGTKGKAAPKPANPPVMTRNPSYTRTTAKQPQRANDEEGNAEATPTVSVEGTPTTSIRRSRAPSRSATVSSSESGEPVRRSTRTRTVVQPAVRPSRASNRLIAKPKVKKAPAAKMEAHRSTRKSTETTPEAAKTPIAPRGRIAGRRAAKKTPSVPQEKTTRRSTRTRTTAKATAPKSAPRRAIAKPKVKKTPATKKKQPRRSISNIADAEPVAETNIASRGRVANRAKTKKTPAGRQQLAAPRTRPTARRANIDVNRRERNIGRRRSSSGSLYFPGSVPTYNGFTLTQHLYGYDMFDDTQADRYSEVICGRSPVATTYFFRGLNPGRRNQRQH